MNSGFYISKIIAKGIQVLDSIVEFKPGCNVVLGDSDRGKTTLFNVIDYMLGRNNRFIENMPPEGVPYTIFFMEVHTSFDDTYTIKRVIGSNDVFVKKCCINDFETDNVNGVKYNTRGNSNISFSDFMLKIACIPNLKIATSSKKNPSKLSYPTIRHLIMVDEIRITNNKCSPFYESENVVFQTKYQNFISYLMAGIDDSDFRPDEDPDFKKSRLNGKLEFIKDELESIEVEMERLGDISYVSISDDAFIKQYQEKIKIMSEELTSQYDRQKQFLNNKQRLEAAYRNLYTFIERMKQLESFYKNDIQRLETILQGKDMLGLLPDATCPLCHHKLDSCDIDSINSEEYSVAIMQEYENTRFKINDINILITAKESNLNILEAKLKKINDDLLITSSYIKSLEPDISTVKEILSRSEKNHEKKIRYSQLKEKKEQLNKKMDHIQEMLHSISRKLTSTRREVMQQEYLDLIKDILVAWNFIKKEEDVIFDYDQFDIMIGNKHRRSYGQGNRGVSCAAMMIALMDFCQKNERPFSSLLVLDSPMSTRYDGKVLDDDNRKMGVLDSFATYCNSRKWEYQIIIIDNKISTNEFDLSLLNNIHFIRFGTEKRKVFFEGSNKENSQMNN